MSTAPDGHRTDLLTAEDIARERLVLMEYRDLREQADAAGLGSRSWREFAAKAETAITLRAAALGLEDPL